MARPKKKVAKKAAVLSRAAIMGIKDREPITVDVPEWGGTVRVRPLSGKERDAILANADKYQDDDGTVVSHSALQALYAINSVIDENGDKLFTIDDFDWLCDRSATALQTVANALTRSSGITEDEEEELEKN